MSWLEILALLATALILFSMFFARSQAKFHSLNAVGYICLAVLALARGRLPAACFCSVFVLLDFCRLYALATARPRFDILEVEPDEPVLRFYCERNKAELDAIFGKNAMSDAKQAAFVFRDNDIAGIIAYSVTEPGTARIAVDYVSPKYRDCETGRHLFIKNTSFWSARGIERLEIYAPGDTHIHYLERMGFTQGNDPATWEKEL